MENFNWKKLKSSTSFKRKVQKAYTKILNDKKSETEIKKVHAVALDNCMSQSKESTFLNLSDVPNIPVKNENGLQFLNYPSTQSEHNDYDSSCSENDEENNNLIDEFIKNDTYRQDLREWAIQFNISHLALKTLLLLCNKRNPNALPKDPRTLLQTPIVTTIQPVGLEGQYWHQGLGFCLKQCFSDLNEPISISININIDGLPIFNSSKQEFWPILFNIFEKPHLRPMVIGIYSGKGKPSSLESYIRPFVNEAREILTNGVAVNDHVKINVKIRSFICDSPARAFIKGVTNFNGQNGCQKCTTVGEYSYISHCNIFPRTECSKRTDEAFRQRTCDSHHKIYTPLEELPGLNMIINFPVADSLHLIDLGIMKRFLIGWRDGKFNNFRTKWSARESFCISERLINIKMPSELHRAVRGLDCLAHWKALEFRTFLYYIGIVILKEHLTQEVYQHFLVFFCAVTICSSTAYNMHLNLAHELFLHFIEFYRDIYGEEHITSNVHNLSHVVDDVRHLGILSTFTAYPFESKLYQIKNMLRNGNNALAQVARRLTETSYVQTNSSMNEGPKSNILTGNAVHLSIGCILNTENKNKWFLTKNDNKIICFKKAVLGKNNQIYVIGCSLKSQENFFETPIRSSFLNIYSSDGKENDQQTYSLNDIKYKMVSLKYKDNQHVFIPLLHTTN